MLDYFILAQDTIDPPKRKSWNRYCFQLQKLRLGFTRKKKKKKKSVCQTLWLGMCV